MKKKTKINVGLLLGVFAILLILYWPILALLIGGYEAPKTQTPLLEAHQKAVTTFVENEGFGIQRFRKPGLWNEFSIVYEDRVYSPSEIRLIGATPEYGDRLFEGTSPPIKDLVSKSEYRKLDEYEEAAISRLKSGVSALEELDVEGEMNRRLFLPIIATSECSRCHEVDDGVVMGAFDYHLLAEEP